MTSFNGNKPDIVHHDGDTMSVKSTLTQTNTHTHILTDILPDETSDIYSDSKDLLLVDPTEAFLLREKTASPSRCICATYT